jgi:hypothetical protein
MIIVTLKRSAPILTYSLFWDDRSNNLDEKRKAVVSYAVSNQIDASTNRKKPLALGRNQQGAIAFIATNTLTQTRSSRR